MPIRIKIIYFLYSLSAGTEYQFSKNLFIAGGTIHKNSSFPVLESASCIE